MNLIKCLLTANDCYKAGRKITPKGVMVHSTGANNPTVKRYVQPLKTDANYNTLVGKFGKNIYANDWNRSGVSKCVHAFIGKLADGTVAAVQTLPWDRRGWHAGTGTSGKSANDTHISFEICEDALTDKTYFAAAYQQAVELTAMLCKEYGLDPRKDGVVICHSEGYKRGIASGHADVMHWFPKFGKSMDTFRADVAALMGVKEDKPEAEAPTAAPAKLDVAKYHNAAYKKTYKVNATAGLNMRTGAGIGKARICTLKHGAKFRCYGYYNKAADGSVWLYGVAPDGQVGYCHKGYLA